MGLMSDLHLQLSISELAVAAAGLVSFMAIVMLDGISQAIADREARWNGFPSSCRGVSAVMISHWQGLHGRPDQIF
jgi:hypothetical protein